MQAPTRPHAAHEGPYEPHVVPMPAHTGPMKACAAPRAFQADPMQTRTGPMQAHAGFAQASCRPHVGTMQAPCRPMPAPSSPMEAHVDAKQSEYQFKASTTGAQQARKDAAGGKRAKQPQSVPIQGEQHRGAKARKEPATAKERNGRRVSTDSR